MLTRLSYRLIFATFYLLLGCASVGVQPRQFDFVTVVEKTEPGPGGWRAACLYALVENMTTGDSLVCKFGVELPLETEREGPISTMLAQRIAADCANEAAARVFRPATAEVPPGLACEEFKKSYYAILSLAMPGARVTQTCHPKTTPVTIGF
jgi:hypothetical protein